MADAVLETVQQIVARIAGANRTPAQVTPETRLADGYWLDSVELLEVVIGCEQAFDVAFDAEEDTAPEAFQTIGSLADVVRRKLARGGA